MAILFPNLTPTAGVPQEVIAPPSRAQRRKRMSDPNFYSSGSRQDQDPEQIIRSVAQGRVSSTRTREPEEFQQEPMTGDYIEESIARFAGQPALPSLQPAARVQAVQSNLVQPSFQAYYDQLKKIGSIGQSAYDAAAARAAFQRAQQAQLLASIGASTPTGGSRPASGGQAYGSAIPANPQANFRFAQEIAPKYGWNASELQAWYTLGMKESGWRNTAQNPTSTAYGIGQFLDKTWGTVGGSKTSDPRLQVEYMARYIQQRYGSPSRALAFHLRNNWY